MENNVSETLAASATPWIYVVLIIAVLAFLIYVRLIQLRNKVKESAADVDVQLKKRYDLLPNMLQMASKFMEHEKNIMTEITKLRTQALETSFADNPQKKIELENLLNQKLNDFKISLENYPDLKSNQTMITAMQSMNEIEEHISAARRFYNANVTSLKNMVEIFPCSIIAHLTRISYKDNPFFEISEEERKPISSKDYFK